MNVRFATLFSRGKDGSGSRPRPRILEACLHAAATLAAVLVLMAPAAGWAQEETAPDWEQTALTLPVLQLYTPASGAFFARSADQLWRSDDGGATWRTVSLPPGGGKVVAVDPAIHLVIYADGQGGLYKTEDDAVTWHLVLPTTDPIQRVVVSPADNRLVLALVGRGPYARYRSLDGGLTWEWEEPGSFLGGPCNWGIWLFQAHPTDPQRVFSTSGCFAGRNRNAVLSQSLDQGTTWTSLFQPPTSFPRRLVGGQGTMPGRLYLVSDENRPPGSAWLYRSDDDGLSWTEVLMLQGAATFDGAAAQVVNGLAYDPSAPDTVYLGLSRLEQGVRISQDGGLTWADLGSRTLGDVNDLALGIDSLNLYAATESGVWRMRLGAPPAPDTPPVPAEHTLVVE